MAWGMYVPVSESVQPWPLEWETPSKTLSLSRASRRIPLPQVVRLLESFPGSSFVPGSITDVVLVRAFEWTGGWGGVAAHLRLLIDLRERGVREQCIVLGDGGVRHGGRESTQNSPWLR